MPSPLPASTAEDVSHLVEPVSLNSHPQTAVGTDVENDRIGTLPAGERLRKLLHMTPGLLPFALAAVPHHLPIHWYQIAIIAGVCMAFTLTFLAVGRHVRRHGEGDFLVTVFSYPLIVVALLCLFRSNVEFMSAVLVVLGLGDGSACVFGRLFGRKKLPWNREKSWVGLFAFVLVSAPLAALAYWAEGTRWGQEAARIPWMLAISCGFAAAIAGAIAESWRTRLSDNLRVGVAASVAVVVAHFATLAAIGPVDWVHPDDRPLAHIHQRHNQP